MARRAALGLTRRQVRMESEPGRREWMSILAGLSIVAVICLGALLWSFIKPAGSVGTSKIVADQDSGAIYVRVNEVLYPALNLSSARLIAGEATNPVRSSATDEDGADASFAGVFDSFLGVVGADAVLDAVRACWSGLHSRRATAYRKRLGTPTTASSMGVGVMRLVSARASGVVFTLDPVTGRDDR